MCYNNSFHLYVKKKKKKKKKHKQTKQNNVYVVYMSHLLSIFVSSSDSLCAKGFFFSLFVVLLFSFYSDGCKTEKKNVFKLLSWNTN